jgi:hypothetical protein
VSDASTTLAELESKLRELERDLAAIGSAARGTTDPEPLDTEVPSASAAAATDTAADGASSWVPPANVRLVDEARPAGGTDPLPPAQRILSRDADPALYPGTAPPEPPFSDAALGSRGAGDGPGEGTSEFDAAGQLELLLRFRDELERSARGLVDDYDRLLSQLQAPARASEPELESERRAPVTAAATPPPAAGSGPAASPRPAASSLPSAQPVPAAPGPNTGAGPAEPSFECRVELDAGPFADVDALSSFESALAGLPHALDARVRRFDGARAAIDLRLALTATLVEEMHEALAVGFSVVDSGPGHLAIVLDRQPQ